MADPAVDYRQVTDIFAVAASHRFTGQMTFHWGDGQPQEVHITWRLKFGEQLRRWVRIFLGRAPPPQP